VIEIDVVREIDGTVTVTSSLNDSVTSSVSVCETDTGADSEELRDFWIVVDLLLLRVSLREVVAEIACESDDDRLCVGLELRIKLTEGLRESLGVIVKVFEWSGVTVPVDDTDPGGDTVKVCVFEIDFDIVTSSVRDAERDRSRETVTVFDCS